MKKELASLLIASGLASQTFAADIDVSITNLTKGIYFTPLLVAAHPSGTQLFTPGAAAGENLRKMAEGGDISGLVGDLNASNADIVQNPAAGLLSPGQTASTSLTTMSQNTYLSITAMMLPTNDGFVALNGMMIPMAAGTYTYMINAYDAGTEANDEIFVAGAGAPGAAGIPADPGGNMGSGATGVSSDIEGFVHIHRGALGDFDATGGSSDLDASIHRWLNPVARVTVTVN